ncbi:AMP-binding protein [Amycolatopsis sp.]|uniref:AMP-binding protein n=1 Tax=Amycolatopsis sp. TaxID=37632 RepID=UPI002D1943B4|nr:AMP-binding protein [Amycolatopsis sp.]HVV10499.1 AMP-binding protein [Amycolatopsis sp.]
MTAELAAVVTDPASMPPARLRAWAGSEPDRPFLSEVTGRAATYGETWDGVRRWVGWLRSLGVREGSRVATLLPSSIDSTLAWLALGCLGALEVPVNPELTGEFLEHVLDDAAPSLVLSRPEFAERLSSCRPALDIRTVERGGAAALAAAPAELTTLPRPEDAACVIYTSGTSGPAKGVVLRWAQFAAVIGRLPLVPEDVTYACHPMFHVTGRTPLVTMCDVGGQVVFRERFSASATMDDVRRFGCTTGTFLAGLLLPQPPRPDDKDNPLRLVFAGHHSGFAEQFAERFAVSVADSYGSTEAGFPLVRLGSPPDHEHVWCGRVRAGYQAEVVDEHGTPVANGTAGELWIKGDSRLMLMERYLNHPGATEKAFSGDWYRTGDIVIRHPGGDFEFLDRARDTLRRLGENISSTAVESVVDRHPALSASAVIGVPDRVAGHEVLLVVEPAGGARVEAAELYEWLVDRVPKHALPRYVVITGALPRTPTGKVRKSAVLDGIELATAWSPAGR